MKVNFKTIPYTEHRYPTIGDYWRTDDGTLEFRVTEMPDWRAEAAVFLHEFVESMLCKQRGITWESIDAFDKQFETEGHGEHDEPGDDPRAPYRNEHRFAENIERAFLAALDLHWDDYDKICEEADK